MKPSTYKIAGYSFDDICEFSQHIPNSREECRDMVFAIDKIEEAFNKMSGSDIMKNFFAASVFAAISHRDNFLNREY